MKMKTSFILIKHYTVDPKEAFHEGETDHFIVGCWGDRNALKEYISKIEENSGDYEILELEDGNPTGYYREYTIETFMRY